MNLCDLSRCGHCKNLAPVSVFAVSLLPIKRLDSLIFQRKREIWFYSSPQTYEKVAAAFKLEEDVVIANLDADKYKDLASK